MQACERRLKAPQPHRSRPIRELFTRVFDTTPNTYTPKKVCRRAAQYRAVRTGTVQWEPTICTGTNYLCRLIDPIYFTTSPRLLTYNIHVSKSSTGGWYQSAKQGVGFSSETSVYFFDRFGEVNTVGIHPTGLVRVGQSRSGPTALSVQYFLVLCRD